MEIGAEAAQFPEKEYINGIAVAVRTLIFLSILLFVILQEYAVQNLDLYYDTESQWPLVYSSSSNLTSCRDKESVLQVQKIMEKGCIEGNPGTDSEAYLQHRTIYCHNRTDEEGTWLIVKKYRHLFYMFIQCQCLILAWKLNKEAIGSSWTLDFSLYILPQ